MNWQEAEFALTVYDSEGGFTNHYICKTLDDAKRMSKYYAAQPENTFVSIDTKGYHLEIIKDCLEIKVI